MIQPWVVPRERHTDLPPPLKISQIGFFVIETMYIVLKCIQNNFPIFSYILVRKKFILNFWDLGIFDKNMSLYYIYIIRV